MFAHFAVLPKSVFSPARPRMSVKYEQRPAAGKPAAKAVVNAVAPQDITTMLGTDELDAVMLAVWKVCSEAPRCAAVNRQFKRAAEVAEAESKVLDVAPHRPQMKVASNPSLTPSVVEDDAVITPWGESLEAFVPSERQRNPVSKDDMQRVLDVKGARGGGWLTNTAVDTYLSCGLLSCCLLSCLGLTLTGSHIFLHILHGEQSINAVH